MPGAGLEPAWPEGHPILSRARLTSSATPARSAYRRSPPPTCAGAAHNGWTLGGARGPLNGIRRLLWGYELWAAFVVAAIATGGSLFFSQIANFPPCELCWFQRICMYPLSILTLLMALASDNRAARYLFPLPIVGAGVS